MGSGTFSVLHGFNPSAGQPALLARALRHCGVDAANVTIGPNKFGYSSDFHFEGKAVDVIRDVLSDVAINYDIIHIHAITPFFEKGMPTFPMGTDLLALKLAGKKIVIHFRGSEIRVPSKFRELSPYHYVDDDTEGLIKRFPEEKQLSYIDLCTALADEILVSDPELLTYVPSARILPRAMDLSEWSYGGLTRNERPLVIHAPSRQGVKGTKHVLVAIDDLRAEGLDFEFRLVEGLPQEEARRLFQDADIIVDQLRIGWYGVLAVEGMALGKAVVSYIRDDLLPFFPGKPPVYVANPETIKDRLRELIVSPYLRQQVAATGHEFCKKTHSLDVVAKECLGIYDGLEPKFDFKRYMEINADQQEMRIQELKEAKNLGSAHWKSKINELKSKHKVINKEKILSKKKPLIVRFYCLAKKEGVVELFRRIKRKIVAN